MTTKAAINTCLLYTSRELIEDEDLKNSPIAFPDLTQYNNLETFLYLGEDGEELYNKYWKEVMSN